MKYYAACVDGNGVPLCTEHCPRAVVTSPYIEAGRIWCAETESSGRPHGVCYAWALDKVSSEDEFPNAEVPF